MRNMDAWNYAMQRMDAWNYAMQRMDASFETLNAFLMGLSSGNVHAGGMLVLSEDMRQSLRAVWNECVTYIEEVEAEQRGGTERGRGGTKEEPAEQQTQHIGKRWNMEQLEQKKSHRDI